MALGGVLISTGIGANIGMGLITEGAADYVTAIRAYCKRSFRWSDYTRQKAVSLAISVTSMGIAKIKDGIQGVKAVVSGVEREALEQAGTQLVMNGQAIRSTLVETGKSLKKLAYQQVAASTSQAVAREGLNQMADALGNFALEKLKPEISSFIQKEIEAKFSEESFRILIRKMYALDQVLESKSFSNLINNIIQKIISSENSRNHDVWDSIGGPLCKGILSDPKLLDSAFSMRTRILGSLKGLTQVTFMIDNIYSQLFKKLSEIDKESLSIHQILQQYYDIPLEDAEEISYILKTKDVIKTHQYEIPNQFATKISQSVIGISPNREDYIGIARQVIGDITSNSESCSFCEHINPEIFELPLSPEERGMRTRDYRPETVRNYVRNIPFYELDKHKNIVLNFCKNLNKSSQTMNNFDDLSQVMKSMSDQITEQIIKVTESHLISPWTSYGVAKLTNHVSASIENHLMKKQINGDIQTKRECLKELEGKENKTPEDLNTNGRVSSSDKRKSGTDPETTNNCC